MYLTVVVNTLYAHSELFGSDRMYILSLFLVYQSVIDVDAQL